MTDPDIAARLDHLEAIVSSISSHSPDTRTTEKALDAVLSRMETIERRMGERDSTIAKTAADSAIRAIEKRLSAASETQLRAVGTVLADLKRETQTAIGKTAADIRSELAAVDLVQGDSFHRAEMTVMSELASLSPSFRE